MNPELLNQFIEAAKQVPKWDDLCDVEGILRIQLVGMNIWLGDENDPLSKCDEYILIGAIEEALVEHESHHGHERYSLTISAPVPEHEDPAWTYAFGRSGWAEAPTRLEAAMRALIACYGEEAS